MGKKSKPAKKKKPKQKKVQKSKQQKSKQKGQPKEGLNEITSKVKKDVNSLRDFMEEEGTLRSVSDILSFEQKQFDYITSKICKAILGRIGRKKFQETVRQLKSGKLTLSQAAKKLGLKMGDLLLLLEKEKAIPKADLDKKIKKQLS